MKALGRLLLLPLSGQVLLTLSGLAMYVFALILVIFQGHGASLAVFLPLFLFSIYFIGLTAGTVLAPLLINESLLLPHFARRLIQAGLILWGLLFGIAIGGLMLSGHGGFIPIAVGVGTLVFACAVAMPVEKIYFAALLVLVFGPQLASKQQLAMTIAWLHSPWTPLIFIVAGTLVLWHAFNGRLRPSDPREAGSPMAVVTSRWVRGPSDANAHARGPGQLLRAIFEGGADYTLQRAIACQHERDTR